MIGHGGLCLTDIESTALDADIGAFIGGGLMELYGRFSWFYSSNPRIGRKVLCRFLNRLSRYDIMVAWNGRLFDVPFLTARVVRHGVPAEALHRIRHLDLAELVKANLRLARTDLHHVARFLGVKEDLDVEGLDVPSLFPKSMMGVGGGVHDKGSLQG